MIHSFLYLLQNDIMKETKTSNIYIDFFINFILISLINFLYNDSKFLINSIKRRVFEYSSLYLFNNINSEIIIETQNSIMDRCGVKISKFIYSKTFQAITYYIKKNNPNGIYSKREPDKNERESNPVFDLFIPDQHKPFLIENNKKIYCTMNLYEDIYETNKDKADLNKKHIIKLFSYDKNTTILDIENFVEKCLIIYKNYSNNKSVEEQYYFCYINGEDNGETLNFNEKIFSTNRTFDTVFFEQKYNYMQKLDFFINNEEWYKKKGIPYHLGILLHGEPGCGKTSIIKATLEQTGRNAVTIPLSRVKTCGELENIFFECEINHKNIPTNKRIYIFEDIDCLCEIIKERDDEDHKVIKNTDKKDNIDIQWELLNKLADRNDSSNNSTNPDDELNLSCILNLFDGIIEMPGRIIIMTTNYPDKIDKALLRHGRIDMNIELKKASCNIILEILSSFYEYSIDEIINICYKNNVDIKDNVYTYTPAYIVNVCQNNIGNIEKCLYVLNNN